MSEKEEKTLKEFDRYIIGMLKQHGFPPHPSPRMLTRYKVGTLSHDIASRIKEHLAECPQCRDLLSACRAATVREK